MKKMLMIFCFITFLCALSSLGEEEFNFKIIVHDSNTITSLTKEEVAKVFLKKTKKWKTNNEKIQPVDLVEDSSVRKNFSDRVLDRRISSVKAYWQKQIFSGRGVPPPEKETDKHVLEYVQDHERAIGYIAQDTETGQYSVKIVVIKEN
ncbi:substrate-binding domain-containing protein [candidate division CSSED10-310 bacterium]|uniref:Substrate-binding domain-containing protein n=1 Tax=candidate division CSSED10-310 bacterium TaxID=2855610 RepID=A0ABV6YU57_UNCC1